MISILQATISNKISKDSIEYKSIKDINKPSNILNIARYGFKTINDNRGGAARKIRKGV